MYGAGHLKSTLMGNSFCLHNTHKIVGLGKSVFENHHTWVIQNFTISTNIALIENQKT